MTTKITETIEKYSLRVLRRDDAGEYYAGDDVMEQILDGDAEPALVFDFILLLLDRGFVKIPDVPGFGWVFRSEETGEELSLTLQNMIDIVAGVAADVPPLTANQQLWHDLELARDRARASGLSDDDRTVEMLTLAIDAVRFLIQTNLEEPGLPFILGGEDS